jgi:hypothetical protein
LAEIFWAVGAETTRLPEALTAAWTTEDLYELSKELEPDEIARRIVNDMKRRWVSSSQGR